MLMDHICVAEETQQQTITPTPPHTAKTVVLKLHHAFYTGVKFVVLVQHPVVLF